MRNLLDVLGDGVAGKACFDLYRGEMERFRGKNGGLVEIGGLNQDLDEKRKPLLLGGEIGGLGVMRETKRRGLRY